MGYLYSKPRTGDNVTINEPISVIVPVYNEESSLADVIEELKLILTRSGHSHEIIVIDDGSVDQSFSVAKNHGCRVIRHEKNRGYGAALKTGITAAKFELILIIDADGTYPVKQVPEILFSLQSADMVVGARINSNVDIPLTRRPAKWILSRLAEYISGERIPDLNSGLRAFPRDLALKYLNILPDRFSFTTTLTVALLCDNHSIKYVPIDYHKRIGKSKILPWDFVNFFSLVLRLSMLFNPLKVFVPISLCFFLLGGTKLALDVVFAILRADKVSFSILAHPIVSTTTLILLLSGLQILLIGMISDGLLRKIAQSLAPEYKHNSLEDVRTPSTNSSDFKRKRKSRKKDV